VHEEALMLIRCFIPIVLHSRAMLSVTVVHIHLFYSVVEVK